MLACSGRPHRELLHDRLQWLWLGTRQGNAPTLWTWTGNAGTVGSGDGTALAMASGTSPSITAAIAPPHGFSLTASGDVLAQLRNPRALVLLVYSERDQHLRLLGRVALGQHPAGLSRIPWALRVGGLRLGAGHYLTELEALIDGTLTTGGPTVSFEVGQGGKLTIDAQSCPALARAGTTTAAAC